jgi:hypothetical protein
LDGKPQPAAYNERIIENMEYKMKEWYEMMFAVLIINDDDKAMRRPRIQESLAKGIHTEYNE